jgi:hypothetical protein
MINLTTIILNLENIGDKLRKVLVKNPNSDLAVSLVKLNAVTSALKSLQKEIEHDTISKEDKAIRLIVEMVRKDIAFTEEDAIKYFHEETK